jgi:hypothetical protein
MSAVSYSRARNLALLAFLSVIANSEQSAACSPVFPLPTLRESFAGATHVYMARLIDLKRSPLYEGTSVERKSAVEDAVFDVLLTLKGEEPRNNEVRTHTEYSPGSCTLSILRPVDVVDDEGNEVANPYSDIWILVVEGKEPYSLRNPGHSRPINLFAEADLRFLLEESQRDRPNKSLQRTRSEQRASER